MSEIVLNDMSEYPQVLRRILQYGERRSPRGLATLDLGFTSIVILNTRAAMPLGIGRNLNPAIGAVEAIQLIAGVSDPDLVLKLAPQMSRYTDPVEYGGSERMFWGAYGERIKLQAQAVIKKLRDDPSSRQAIITLWDPWMDNVPGKHDYPCTIALHLFVTSGVLEMNVIMRSNDAWLGFPYDVFQFTQLQATLALSLGYHVGTYRHTVLSFHLYESNEAAARELVANFLPQTARVKHGEIYQPFGIGRPAQPFPEIMYRALSLLNNVTVDDETPSERWYREQLHPSHVG